MCLRMRGTAHNGLGDPTPTGWIVSTWHKASRKANQRNRRDEVSPPVLQRVKTVKSKTLGAELG